MEDLELLPKHYQDYHSTSDSGITKESLVKQAREFLSSVKPKERFMHLGSYDFYENVLGKIVEKSEGNKESIQMITTGLSSLEKYGVNLWKFPWRKEYHTIKLYTAFFKCNVGQNLQDRETILELLNSLGYTVMEQQKVVIKELDKERAIWTSLTLFLAQVDLQVIKEIMDHFPDGEFTLKEIVRARSKTPDVGTAVYYLRRKASKRRKIEEEPSDVPSHERTKDTHIGRVEVMNNVRSDAATSADQNTIRPSKRSALSKGREDVAADSDDSLTGSTVSKTHPSAGMSTRYNIPSETTGRRYFASMNTVQIPEHDLYGTSPQGSQPQHNLDARYSTAPQAGPRYDADLHNVASRYSTVPQTRISHYSGNTKETHPGGHPQYYDIIKDKMAAAKVTSHSLTEHGTVPPHHSTHHYSSHAGSVRGDAMGYGAATGSGTMGAATDTYGYQPKISTSTEKQVHGSARGDPRYANVGDVNSSVHQQFGTTELSSKESWRRYDDRGATLRQSPSSEAEPMEVEQKESSRERRNNATSLHNGVTDVAYAKATGHSEVTELDDTMKHQLTLESSVGLSGRASSQLSGASSEPRRQYGTRSKDGTTREMQPSTSLYQTKRNFTSAKEVGERTRSSAGDVTSFIPEKGVGKKLSPVPSRRISAQSKEIPAQQQPFEVQNPDDTLKNDRQTESIPNSQASLSQGANTSEQGGRVDKKNVCDMCMLRGTYICRNCFRFVCGKCKKHYDTDLCGATKEQHRFKELKINPVQQRKSEISSQPYENIDEGIGYDGQDWSCSRCTFFNPPDNKICEMCATTRGVDPVELTQAGSRVCRYCTYHNEENATKCKACSLRLDLQNPETSV